MPDLEIVCVEFNHINLLETIACLLEEQNGFRIHGRQEISSLDEFYDARRQQYDALKILKHFQSAVSGNRMVLYTSVDLYIPIFTFVFGLAGLGGNTAIVSSFRLMNEFYGLAADDDKLVERMAKETVHEYGHLVHLRHCPNYHCVMASSNTVDDLDIKGNKYCPACLGEIISRTDS